MAKPTFNERLAEIRRLEQQHADLERAADDTRLAREAQENRIQRAKSDPQESLRYSHDDILAEERRLHGLRQKEGQARNELTAFRQRYPDLAERLKTLNAEIDAANRQAKIDEHKEKVAAVLQASLPDVPQRDLELWQFEIETERLFPGLLRSCVFPAGVFANSGGPNTFEHEFLDGIGRLYPDLLPAQFKERVLARIARQRY